ncbi:uncharacterized protein B0I36DRAFT_100217 [Microdochium trichocladiopsis]|uniref:Uncharacterized protein n=1 Tax=Microdochium trichocladiopsis TaxID=1682393 RepID=A0A9P8Y7V9_9PEZI|nr:uncharacterized protein B0I36DRAFT_100217 [Microdochium trichocladiopsis]KAH7032747.1 hypothetical protein B0I36DRAFT_100217 [Microdochium trichocladiopsis]
MAYIQSSHSQGTEGSFVAHKPAENISPEAYYQDPARQQRQRRWYIAKLVLHCIVWSIALALVVIDLCVISWLGFDFVTYSICSIWPAIASLCWITAELGTLAWRRTLSRGIDPRWNLSLHLLLWCGFACAAAFGGIFGRYEYYYYHYYYLSVPSAAYDLVDNRVVVISSLVISLV